MTFILSPWFLLPYLFWMFLLCGVLIRIQDYYEKRGNRRAQWVMVGVTFLLAVAHWTWPSILRGTL